MTVTDLDQQLAELQSAADAYAARRQFIEDLTWPQGVRIAVNFTCDFDAMLLRRLLNEPPMQLAQGEFGGRVGIRRPAGPRSSHSAKLIRQYGYIYRSEGSADQRPHYEFDEGGGNGLINLPMHYVIDDA